MTHLATNKERIVERSQAIAAIVLQLANPNLCPKERKVLEHNVRVHQQFIKIYQKQ